MLKTTALAALALACLIVNADARPKSVAACVETGTLMQPSCNGNNFLAGVKSIKVTLKRVRAAAISGKPANCPHAWCGCWLASYFGIADRSLWRARKWADLGVRLFAPREGAIVVWAHHVGLIKAVQGEHILVLSGNDGHAVRQRWRGTAGVIAYRVLG